jgi:hypothetical protein
MEMVDCAGGGARERDVEWFARKGMPRKGKRERGYVTVWGGAG